MPVGLIDPAEFTDARRGPPAGDKVVIYTDGITEAQSTRRRVLRAPAAARDGARRRRGRGCAELHDAILRRP